MFRINLNKHKWLFIVAVSGLLTCKNPFAPEYREGEPLENLLGNPMTIEGFYTRFQNAYRLRDTTLYGPLIHPEFTFTYRNLEQNVDVSWGRVEELMSTGRLFQYSREIDLTWNNSIVELTNGLGTEAQFIRRFDLIVSLDGSDVIRTDGSANFVLQRADTLQPWRLIRWRDQSDL
jgi:hypothetical protein